MEALRSYRAIRPDLPGSGRSPAPFDELSFETMAEQVAAAARALGVSQAHFVGHSMGTILCQMVAARHPGLVRSLILFGALAEPTEATRAALAGRARLARADGMQPIADQIVEHALAPSTRSSQPAAVAFVRESIMRQEPEGYARNCEALAKATAADPRLIGAPALLLTGEADAVNPPGVAQALADRIAGARLIVVDRGGHWLTVERAAESNQRIADFLKRVEQ
jgi:pimeloyl-ACP methyl ester carboxylesterase